MAKFEFKSDYILAPIKAVLPGIIIATAGFFLFNNPEKVRSKSSYKAWKTLAQFDDIYQTNTEELNCGFLNTEFLYKDLLHLQEMTIENLKALREDKDVDKLMVAIINLRIDTYTQLKNITADFIDSLSFYYSIPIAENDVASRNWLAAKEQILQEAYLINRDHISFRDTGIIKNLGMQLKKMYRSFSKETFQNPNLISIDTLQNRILGTWAMQKDDLPVEVDFTKLNSGNIGGMRINGKSELFTWQFAGRDSTKLTIKFSNVFLANWVLDIKYCSKKILQYRDIYKSDLILAACRLK